MLEFTPVLEVHHLRCTLGQVSLWASCTEDRAPSCSVQSPVFFWTAFVSHADWIPTLTTLTRACASSPNVEEWRSSQYEAVNPRLSPTVGV